MHAYIHTHSRGHTAGVYNEYLIKGTTDSVYWQNIQLYFFSCAFCIIQQAFFPQSNDNEGGERQAGEKQYAFLEGFDTIAW